MFKEMFINESKFSTDDAFGKTKYIFVRANKEIFSPSTGEIADMPKEYDLWKNAKKWKDFLYTKDEAKKLKSDAEGFEIKEVKALTEARNDPKSIKYTPKKVIGTNEVMSLIQNYDLYTDYIDDYKTMEKAKQKNKDIIYELKKRGVETFTIGDKTIEVQ